MAVTATFQGHYTTGYLQYLNLASGHTLVAVPGHTYDIMLASGWDGRLAVPPADGQWAAGAPLFPGQFSGVPGFASPGAFFPGSPGTPLQPDPVMFAIFRAAAADEAERLRQAEELRVSEQAEEARLLRAGWTGEELTLRRAGWAAGDIRRHRQRKALLKARTQSR